MEKRSYGKKPFVEPSHKEEASLEDVTLAEVSAADGPIATAADAAIRIQCADNAVRAVLQAWADSLRLKTPVTVVLDIAIGTEYPECEGILDRQAGVAFYTGRRGALCVRWDTARATARLEPGSTTASITLSLAALARLDECASFFLGAVLVVLLRRVGWHYLQGAIARDPEGRGWLVVDEPGAGKSATSTLLAQNGWHVGNDNVVFLRQGRHGRAVVIAAGPPIACRPDVDGRFEADLIEPDVIAFASSGTDAATQAERLAPREALALLIRSSEWAMIEPALAQGHLDLLGRLACQARSFRVRLAPDLFTRPERLQELIA